VPVDRCLILGGLILFVTSLALPAIEGSGFPSFSGFDVLRQGAGAWRDGIVAWYANPLLLVALITGWMRWYRLAFGAALVGALLALSSYSAGMMAEGSGRSVPAFHFAAGFYVWLLAFALAVAAPLAGIYKESAPRDSDRE
jgi:hypothetical protein